MTQVDWGMIIEKALLAVIGILLPIALGKLVGFLNQKTAEAKTSDNYAQMKLAADIVYQLVLAAEQNGLIGALKNEGLEKKRYVLARAEAKLAEYGIKMDLDTIDDLVEASVHEAFKKIDLSGWFEGKEPA